MAFLQSDFVLNLRRHGFKNLIILIVILGIVSALFFVLYFVQFHHGLSNESSRWADFGQYISGVFTLTISLINLLVIVYFAYTTSKNEQHRWETQLRNENFKDLLIEFRKVNDKISTGLSIQHLWEYLEATDLNNYFYLWMQEKETLKKLQVELIASLKNLYGSMSFVGQPEPSNNLELEDCKKKYLELKSDITIFLSGKIMHNDIAVNQVVKKYFEPQKPKPSPTT
jgi:hypothetical protein